MATKKIFTIDGSSISNMIKALFGKINNSRFSATSKSGKSIINLPLLLVIIIAIVFPVVLIPVILAVILLKINISIEKNITNDLKLIE